MFILKLPPLFLHLHGRGEKAALSKETCVSQKLIRFYIVLALEINILYFYDITERKEIISLFVDFFVPRPQEKAKTFPLWRQILSKSKNMMSKKPRKYFFSCEKLWDFEAPRICCIIVCQLNGGAKFVKESWQMQFWTWVWKGYIICKDVIFLLL